MMVMKRTTCRVCIGQNLHGVLSLGSTPPANAFLRPDQLQLLEQSFPLELQLCRDCGFVQLADVVSPELLFRNYVYVSSTSPAFVSHFETFSETMIGRLSLPGGALVVDIGSNDGILLRPFKNRGRRVLGIDPAIKIAEMATSNGIETKPVFFSPTVAGEIVRDHGTAHLVTATSVFPHVDDLDEIVEGVKILLAPDGVFVIEAYYLRDLIEKNLFDTVYHEHLSYFTVHTLCALFKRLGMEVFDIERTDTHGGSLRVFVQKRGGSRPPHTAAIDQFFAEEETCGLSQEATFIHFGQRIGENKRQLLQLLGELKSAGKKIVGYGAPAKATTLLSYFGIGKDTIDYVVDDSSWKQGLFMPGTHLPVVGPEHLAVDHPDYILILAWNFAEPIMKKLVQHERFIIPVPRPLIIENIVDQDLYSIIQSLGKEAQLLSGKTVVITGGSGFIGSYMVATVDMLNKYFLPESCRVVSIDNHIVGKKNNLLREISSPAITFLEHNVCTPFTVEGSVDYIINAAGVASPIYYKKYPIETIEGTIFGLKNTLELARVKQAKSVLYFSSSEIYGDPDPNVIPTPETYKGNVSSIGPRSCYDESKRLGETLAMSYHQVHHTPIKIVRPFNVYGPGMSSKDYRVIPTFLSQGMEGKALTVHDKGNQTRTFCYVTDAIVGFLKVLLFGADGEVYNIGNDNDEINMKVLADTVAEVVFDNKIAVNLVSYPDNYPQDEPRRRCPDLTKAKKSLGYSAKVDLKVGLKRSYRWFKNSAALS
ncbi:MAG: NAD-dependent epimerase/dehydratase family protein [Candidatus Magasanikbacteria bacterium]|nr:NAD-dependent epimerase/dehydratase family protein [Candidatus Magasanikbacteria bacterium]